MNLASHYPETNILPLCQDIFHFPAQFPLAKYCAEVNVRCLNSTVSITALFTIARTWKQSFPVGSDDKEPPCNAGDPGSIPGLGRYPGEGNGNPLQCSCLKIPWTEEPVGYSPWIHKELDIAEQLTHAGRGSNLDVH